MKPVILTIVGLVVALAGISAQTQAGGSARSEDASYMVGTAPANCGSPWPTQAWVCFDVLPGEGNFSIRAYEDGPLASAGRIQGRMTFVGSHAFVHEFCDDVGGRIPPGTTRIELSLDFGDLGYCGGGNQVSPVFHGHVTASFFP